MSSGRILWKCCLHWLELFYCNKRGGGGRGEGGREGERKERREWGKEKENDSRNHEFYSACNDSGASLVAQMVKYLPAMQETQVWSLGWEDPLEKGMATHSSILAWRIPWTEMPGALQSVESQRDTTQRLTHFPNDFQMGFMGSRC